TERTGSADDPEDHWHVQRGAVPARPARIAGGCQRDERAPSVDGRARERAVPETVVRMVDANDGIDWKIETSLSRIEPQRPVRHVDPAPLHLASALVDEHDALPGFEQRRKPPWLRSCLRRGG